MFGILINSITRKNYSKENNQWIKHNIKKIQESDKGKKIGKITKQTINNVKKDLLNMDFIIEDSFVVL